MWQVYYKLKTIQKQNKTEISCKKINKKYILLL